MLICCTVLTNSRWLSEYAVGLKPPALTPLLTILSVLFYDYSWAYYSWYCYNSPWMTSSTSFLSSLDVSSLFFTAGAASSVFYLFLFVSFSSLSVWFKGRLVPARVLERSDAFWYPICCDRRRSGSGERLWAICEKVLLLMLLTI